MKIAFTSDIHYDISPRNRDFTAHLAAALERLRPDVFVIAGDLSPEPKGLEDALSLFAELPCEKVMVAGNHDLWVSRNAARKGRDSWHKYTSLIPEICRRHGFLHLATDPVVIDGIGFVGSVGWYDFSLRDPELDTVYSRRDYERGEFFDRRFPTGIWSDMQYAHWLRSPDASDWRERSIELSTPQVFDRVFELFQEKVAEVLGRTRELVAVVHTAPFDACVWKGETPDPFDAYGGSERLGEFLVELVQERPVTCLSGHQHTPLDTTVNGVRVLRAPVGYLRGPSPDDARKADATLGVLILQPEGGSTTRRGK